jgi:hypothetical protein
MTNIQSSTQGVETHRRLLIFLAWGAILIISTPTIILRLLVQDLPAEPLTPYWLAGLIVAVLVLLLGVTWISPAVKHLRGFFLALVAFSLGFFFGIPFLYGNAAIMNWVEGISWGGTLMVAQVLDHIILAPLIALTLIGSGIGRKALFLTQGNPKALAQPTPLLPGLLKGPSPWNRVALQFLPFFVVILSTVLWILVRPDVSMVSRALIYLPSIIIAAIINAFAEEFEFRMVLLARLEPVLGSKQAILLTMVLFGLPHYFGAPSGPFGVLLALFLGWVMAKSMIETRGLVWAFSLHFLADFIIYIFAAMMV